MKFGVRNQLTGVIKEVKKGALMCQIDMDVEPNCIMSSIMTLDSLDELGVKAGDTVRILVKAVNVVLAKD